MLFLLTLRGDVLIFEMKQCVFIYSQSFTDYEIVNSVMTEDTHGVAVIDSHGLVHQINIVIDKLVPFIIGERSIDDRLDLAVMLSQ